MAMATFSPETLKRGLSPGFGRVLAASLLALAALTLLLAVVMMVARTNAARDEALVQEQRSYDIMPVLPDASTSWRTETA